MLCIAVRRCSPRRSGVREKYASLPGLCAPYLWTDLSGLEQNKVINKEEQTPEGSVTDWLLKTAWEKNESSFRTQRPRGFNRPYGTKPEGEGDVFLLCRRHDEAAKRTDPCETYGDGRRIMSQKAQQNAQVKITQSRQMDEKETRRTGWRNIKWWKW